MLQARECAGVSGRRGGEQEYDEPPTHIIELLSDGFEKNRVMDMDIIQYGPVTLSVCQSVVWSFYLVHISHKTNIIWLATFVTKKTQGAYELPKFGQTHLLIIL